MPHTLSHNVHAQSTGLQCDGTRRGVPQKQQCQILEYTRQQPALHIPCWCRQSCCRVDVCSPSPSPSPSPPPFPSHSLTQQAHKHTHNGNSFLCVGNRWDFGCLGMLLGGKCKSTSHWHQLPPASLHPSIHPSFLSASYRF